MLGAFAISGAAAISMAQPPVPLQLTGYQLQLGETQRSFIRYIDLTFNSSPGTIRNLLDTGRLKVTCQDLLNSRTNNINDLNTLEYNLSLTGYATVSGNTIRIDFGVLGIGGNSTGTTRDGYLRVKFDADGDGVHETVKRFYKLLGDGNADRVVTSAIDKNFDLNGDGKINSIDVNQASIRNGRRIAGADVLPVDPNIITSP